MIDELPGHRCEMVRIVSHRMPGENARDVVALEFAWDDSTVLTIDVNADWTLCLSRTRWVEPFPGATAAERELFPDLGIWEVDDAPVGPASIVGRTVTAAEPMFNEVGEFSGITILLEGVSVRAFSFGGDLQVELGRQYGVRSRLRGGNASLARADDPSTGGRRRRGLTRRR
ncbi:MAG: hypothetical protein NVV66_11715 [Cellulomonas sp.]|uniref:hypothetical protein n=1 Tax=Cellulomonas sp. TaxID=40001 RepID=UPI00258E083F|nr:hypothetical protein [Cellulomonas sp.]MCR6705323.1 hypothetical protein [Cellulomonas sp.]